MIYAALFIFELIILYIVSGALSKQIFKLLDSLLHNRKRTMWLFAILFLPGTTIHELSHWLMATILFVPTGDISIMPKLEENKINLGHAEIGKSDLFRRFFIGVAPFISGLTIIFLTIHFFENDLSTAVNLLILGFVVFQIGNTMFSSKRDWQGAWVVILIFAAIITALYILNIPVHEYIFTNKVSEIVKTADVFLLIPILVDLVLVILIKIL